MSVSLGSAMSSDGKGKVHPRSGREGTEGEYMYSSTLSLTSVLDGVSGQRHGPAALPPGKTRSPLYGRLGGPQGRCGRVAVSPLHSANTGLFISPSGISELDCATTKTDTAERSISIGRESLQGFFFLY